MLCFQLCFVGLLFFPNTVADVFPYETGTKNSNNFLKNWLPNIKSPELCGQTERFRNLNIFSNFKTQPGAVIGSSKKESKLVFPWILNFSDNTIMMVEKMIALIGKRAPLKSFRLIFLIRTPLSLPLQTVLYDWLCNLALCLSTILMRCMEKETKVKKERRSFIHSQCHPPEVALKKNKGSSLWKGDNLEGYGVCIYTLMNVWKWVNREFNISPQLGTQMMYEDVFKCCN